jgi:hypothetical protein
MSASPPLKADITAPKIEVIYDECFPHCLFPNAPSVVLSMEDTHRNGRMQ